jgi:hypothetical protein
MTGKPATTGQMRCTCRMAGHRPRPIACLSPRDRRSKQPTPGPAIRPTRPTTMSLAAPIARVPSVCIGVHRWRIFLLAGAPSRRPEPSPQSPPKSEPRRNYPMNREEFPHRHRNNRGPRDGSARHAAVQESIQRRSEGDARRTRRWAGIRHRCAAQPPALVVNGVPSKWVPRLPLLGLSLDHARARVHHETARSSPDEPCRNKRPCPISVFCVHRLLICVEFLLACDHATVPDPARNHPPKASHGGATP